ncbi:hypothetical protein [uncultured Thomasclavelia sp.]|nr:hypothetical protein [uncultured Thomasclavelia sp.]
MVLFTRKKKITKPINEFKVFNSISVPLVPFGTNILKSDAVMIAIDRMAT